MMQNRIKNKQFLSSLMGDKKDNEVLYMPHIKKRKSLIAIIAIVPLSLLLSYIYTVLFFAIFRVKVPEGGVYNNFQLVLSGLGSILGDTTTIIVLCNFLLKDLNLSKKDLTSEILRYLQLKFLRRNDVVLGILIGVSYVIITLAFVNIINLLMPHSVSSNNTTKNIVSHNKTISFVPLIFLIGIIVPICEELMFRLIVFKSLLNIIPEKFMNYLTSKNMRIFFSGFITSIIFALFHFQGFSNGSDFYVLGVTFVLSFILISLLSRTRSAYTNIFTHMTYNTMYLLLSLLS